MKQRITPVVTVLVFLALSISALNGFVVLGHKNNNPNNNCRRYLQNKDNYQRKTRLLSSVVDHDPLNGISNLTPIIDDSQTNNVQIVSAMDNTISIKNNEKKLSSEDQYALSPQQFVYVILTCVFVSSLLIADIIGVKLFEITLPFTILGHKTIEHSCGVLIFPITFLLGDVINEYFGPKAATRTVYIGLAMSIMVFIIINFAQALPYLDKPFNVSKESFDTIFGSAKLIYFASVTAYFLGSLSDIYIFGVIKRYTKGKLLWLRAVGSTLISQILDSFFVSYIAFSLGKSLTGQTPASFEEVLNIAVTGYGLKFFLGIGMTPILYFMKYLLSERLGLKAIPATSADEE